MDMQQYTKFHDVITKHLAPELNHFEEELEKIKDDPTLNFKLILISFIMLGLMNKKLMLQRLEEVEEESVKEDIHGFRKYPRN